MFTTTVTAAEKEKSIKIMEENPVVINDHTNKEETITGLVEFINPDKDLACCMDAMYYSLNACYINKNGKLCCSTYSIGGVLGGYVDSEALKNYNKSCLLESAKIKCVHCPDGTKIYPAA